MSKKNILIIGASSEVGFPLCKKLLQNGHNVIAHANSRISLFTSLNQKFSNQLLTYTQNFNNPDELVENIFPRDFIGAIHGIIHCPSPPIEIKHVLKTPWSDFEKHINVHLKSLHLILQYLNNLKMLSRTRLVVVNSELSIMQKIPKGYSSYASSKIALSSYCSSINEDIKADKLIVNQISPGMFDSRLLEKIPAYLKEFNEGNKIDPKTDILKVVEFLLFEASDKIRNQNIHISSE
jgi:NAD(P)-dependent dehydrogenase (short-subunit alcohol dehydrogenase family)